MSITSDLCEAGSKAIQTLAQELDVRLVDVVISIHVEGVPTDQPNAGLLVEHESDGQTLFDNVVTALAFSVRI